MTKEDIIFKYNQGKSTVDLAKLTGFSRQHVYNILKNNNVVCRKVHNIYSCNNKYFEVIDTEEKAYWLGFLMADGNISRNRVRINLHERDVEHLYKFTKSLSSNHKIGKTSKGTQYNQRKVEICSPSLCEDLIKIGCIENKTFKLQFPNINEHLIRHFVRGYFDGDGSLSFGKKQGKYLYSSICIVGTESFCNSLIKVVSNELQITTSLRQRFPDRFNSTRMLEISGNKQVLKFLEWIYGNCTIYLDRKYNKYYSLIEEYRDVRKISS